MAIIYTNGKIQSSSLLGYWSGVEETTTTDGSVIALSPLNVNEFYKYVGGLRERRKLLLHAEDQIGLYTNSTVLLASRSSVPSIID